MVELPSNIPPQPGTPPAMKTGKRNGGQKAAGTVPKYVMPSHPGVQTMRILLEDNPDIPPTGQFIGHNGNSYLLQTGRWIEVPLPIIDILNNAVQQQPVLNAAKQVVDWREKLRYPYRVAPGQFQTAA